MRERWGVQVLDADEDLALLELSQPALFNFEDLSKPLVQVSLRSTRVKGERGRKDGPRR